MQSNRWLLPDGVEEFLAPQTWQLEHARRDLLNLYWRWGYDLIRPPMIEYLDSLLTGTGKDLELLTFKVVDQVSGRMLGVRSDLTTQTARIDAHRMQGQGPRRYCYIGSVLRTRPEDLGGSRSPLQIGVEIFGETGLAGDIEVISLMLETFSRLGVKNVQLDLGHVAIYRSLIARAQLPAALEPKVFDIIQRKSKPDLDDLFEKQEIGLREYQWLVDLIDLNGPPDILEQAQRKLAGIDTQIDEAIEMLGQAIAQLKQNFPDISLTLDLAELRGYRYKTGLLYAAFVPGVGHELARGGRYDHVGAAFGRARPATGFSADLNALADVGLPESDYSQSGIYVPASTDSSLAQKVDILRGQGKRVITAIAGDQSTPQELGCTHQLIKNQDGQWQVVEL